MIKTSVAEHEKKWVQCLVEMLVRWQIRIILESPTSYKWIVPKRSFSLGKKKNLSVLELNIKTPQMKMSKVCVCLYMNNTSFVITVREFSTQYRLPLLTNTEFNGHNFPHNIIYQLNTFNSWVRILKWLGSGGGSLWVWTSLFYKVSYRIVRNPVLKTTATTTTMLE